MQYVGEKNHYKLRWIRMEYERKYERADMIFYVILFFCWKLGKKIGVKMHIRKSKIGDIIKNMMTRMKY